ncbi:MAG: hypothetical protein JWM58_4083 [Rhizobium sp.]|nr:hypothetical protein [Rhizobium sp.]
MAKNIIGQDQTSTFNIFTGGEIWVLGATDLAVVLDLKSVKNGDTTIHFGKGDSLVLEGIKPGELTKDNVEFNAGSGGANRSF